MPANDPFALVSSLRIDATDSPQAMVAEHGVADVLDDHRGPTVVVSLAGDGVSAFQAAKNAEHSPHDLRGERRLVPAQRRADRPLDLPLTPRLHPTDALTNYRGQAGIWA